MEPCNYRGVEPLSKLLPITGKRITLRRLTSADLADFQDYRTDASVGLYQGWQPQSDEQASAYLDMASTAELFQPGVWFQIGIADCDSGRLIGDIGICLDSSAREAEIGFSLHRQSQGRGLASEAVSEAISFIFSNTECDRVKGVVDARNHAAVQLLERLGMRNIETVDAIFAGQPCKEHGFVLHRTIT
jgi:RimJ/RimL family protein N-acetyltransferase